MASKILLIVDLEEKYLYDDDILGMIDSNYWDEVRMDLKNKFNEIAEQIKNFKNEGFEVHFTGKTNMYHKLHNLIDKVIPYWSENKELLHDEYSKKDIYVGGLFYERCVKAVSDITNGKILKNLSVSHGIIGDDEDYFY